MSKGRSLVCFLIGSSLVANLGSSSIFLAEIIQKICIMYVLFNGKFHNFLQNIFDFPPFQCPHDFLTLFSQFCNFFKKYVLFLNFFRSTLRDRDGSI